MLLIYFCLAISDLMCGLAAVVHGLSILIFAFYPNTALISFPTLVVLSQVPLRKVIVIELYQEIK